MLTVVFSFFIVQTLSFMHCTCNFIFGLSDVIIKTFSQSVSYSVSNINTHGFEIVRQWPSSFGHWLSYTGAVFGTLQPIGLDLLAHREAAKRNQFSFVCIFLNAFVGIPGVYKTYLSPKSAQKVLALSFRANRPSVCLRRFSPGIKTLKIHKNMLLPLRVAQSMAVRNVLLISK